jgi:serine carboxypeptidase 1
VENSTLLVREKDQATTDLLAFLEKFFDSQKSLQKTPFFVVGESYGGKFATELGVALVEKINAGSLDINFKGKVSLNDIGINVVHVWLESSIMRVNLKRY